MSKLRFLLLSFGKKLFVFVLFVSISGVLFDFMGYPEVANKGPLSRHMYRQSDSYAFALNYYYEGNRFMEPSLLCVIENQDGKAVSEFPILYYITAKIWKFTGVSPLVLRLIDLTILFIGLFCLYKLSYALLRDHFWAALVSLFMFSSPLLGYYGFNFVPNIPALGLALIATYFHYRYHVSSKLYLLALSTFFFAFAALLKISGLLIFLAINAVLFFVNVGEAKQKKPKALVTQLISVFIVFAVVLSWYGFARMYNEKYDCWLFRQGIIPIWDLSSEHISAILDVVYTNTVIYFLNPYALVALGCFFVASVVFWKKTDRGLLLVTSVLLLGSIMFILLFFEGMDHHEYFLIDITIIIAAITLTFLSMVKELLPKLFKSLIFKLLAFVLLVLSLNYGMVMTRVHYNPKDEKVLTNYPLPTKVQLYWEYCQWDWEVHRAKYEGIVPYIRSLGIKYEDRVISVPDDSPNITLVLLQQKGFTDYHYLGTYNGAEATRHRIELGAKYMVVQGDEYLLREDVAPFTKNQIGEYNGIKIFKLVE